MSGPKGKTEQVLEFMEAKPTELVALPKDYMENFDRRLSQILFVRHEAGTLHNSFEWGYSFYEHVKNHDLEALRGILSIPAEEKWQHGVLGPNQLRSAKNACICLISYVVQSACKERIADNEQLYSVCDACVQLVEEATGRKETLLCTYASLVTISEKIYANRTTNYHYLVRQAKEYIYTHFHERITVESIAENLKVSVPYLARVFKDAEDITVKQYIQRERIKSAKNLLRYSTDSIQTISQYLCFSSQSHFTEIFRKQTGMTPLTYRNQYSQIYKKEL